MDRDFDDENYFDEDEEYNNPFYYENGEYAGTYAHDVAGYDDWEIDAAFDGDPEAYWNID